MFEKKVTVAPSAIQSGILIDTHCHINMMVKQQFDINLLESDFYLAEKIIKQASEANVKIILNVGTSLIESLNCIKLAENFDNVYASVGIHPNDLTDNWQKDLVELEKFLTNHNREKIVAIGECGIDLHYPNYDLKKQKEAFKRQIELALKYNLALVVHSRDAADITFECLSEFKETNLRGTLHCFSYSESYAEEAIKYNFVIGIDAPITYPKNEELRNVVKKVGLDNIVLETDAPFLPPQIIRGKQNHPLYTKLIAEFIANLLNDSYENVCQKTTTNALKTFKFDLSNF